MKILTICTGWKTHTQFISDNAKADAAYAALKSSMDTYDKFGNDKAKSVTIDAGDGQATYRIETLVMVTLDDCATCEATIIEREVWAKTIEAKVIARLVPAA